MFVLLLLIGIAVGAYFVLSGNIDTLKKPFFDSLKEYDPNDKSSSGRALVEMWDDWQQQVCYHSNRLEYFFNYIKLIT